MNRNGAPIQQLSFRHLRRQSKVIELAGAETNSVGRDSVHAFEDDDVSSGSRNEYSPPGTKPSSVHHHRESSSSTNSESSPRGTSVSKLLLRIDETIDAKEERRRRGQQQQQHGSGGGTATPSSISTVGNNYYSESNSSTQHGVSGSISTTGRTNTTSKLSPKTQSGSIRMASTTTNRSAGVNNTTGNGGGHMQQQQSNYNNNANNVRGSLHSQASNDDGDVAADIAGYSSNTNARRNHTLGPNNEEVSGSHHHSSSRPVRESVVSMASFSNGSKAASNSLRIATHAVSASNRMQHGRNSTTNSLNGRRHTQQHNNNNNNNNSSLARSPTTLYHSNSMNIRDLGESEAGGSFLAEDDLASMFTPRNGQDDDTVSLFSTYASAFPQPQQAPPPPMAPIPQSSKNNGNGRTQITAVKVSSNSNPPTPTSKRNNKKGRGGGGDNGRKGKSSSSASKRNKKGASSSSSNKHKKVSRGFVTRLIQTCVALLILLAILCIVVVIVGVEVIGNLENTLGDQLVASLNAAPPPSNSTAAPAGPPSSVLSAAIIADIISDAKSTFTGVGVGLVAGFMALVALIAIIWVVCYVLYRRRKQAKKKAASIALIDAKEAKSSVVVDVLSDADDALPSPQQHQQPASTSAEKYEKNRRDSTLSVGSATSSITGKIIGAFMSFSTSSSSGYDYEDGVGEAFSSDPNHVRHRSSSANNLSFSNGADNSHLNITNTSNTISPRFLEDDDRENNRSLTPVNFHHGSEGVTTTASGGILSPDRLHHLLTNQDMGSIFDDDDDFEVTQTRSIRGGGQSTHSGKFGGFEDDDEDEGFGGTGTVSPSQQSPASNNQKANMKLVRGTVLTVSLTNLLPTTIASASTNFALPSQCPTWLNEEGNAVGLFVEKIEGELYVRASKNGANYANGADQSQPVKNPVTSLSSTQLSGIISRFISEVTVIVEKFGGVIDCTAPTEIVATFNYHARIVQHEDVACRCALMIDNALRVALLDWIRIVVVVSTGNNMVGLLSGTSNQSQSSPSGKVVEVPVSTTSTSSRKMKTVKPDFSNKTFTSAAQQATSHHRLLAGESLDICRKIVPLCVHQLHARVIVTDSTLQKSDLTGIPIDVIEPSWETRMCPITVAVAGPTSSSSPLTFTDNDSVHSRSIKNTSIPAVTAPPPPPAAAIKTITLYELVPGGLRKRKATTEVRDLTAAFQLFRRLKFVEARAKYAQYRFVNFQAYRLASLCEYMQDCVDRMGPPEGITRYSRREVHWEDPTVGTDAFSFQRYVSSSSPSNEDSGMNFVPSLVQPNDSEKANNNSVSGTPFHSADILVGGGGGNTSNPLGASGVYSIGRHQVPSGTTSSQFHPRRGSAPVIRVLTPAQWLTLVCTAAIARDSIPMLKQQHQSYHSTAAGGNNNNNNDGCGGASPSSLAPRTSIRTEMLVSFSSINADGDGGNSSITHNSNPSIVAIPDDHPVLRYRHTSRTENNGGASSSLTTPNNGPLDNNGGASITPFAGWGSPNLKPTGGTAGASVSGYSSNYRAGGADSESSEQSSHLLPATVPVNGDGGAITAEDEAQSANDAYLEAVMGIGDVSSPTRQPLTNPYHNNREVGLAASPTMSWRAGGVGGGGGGGGMGSSFNRRGSVVSISETPAGFRPTASNLNSHHAAMNARNGGLPSFAPTASLNGSTSSRKSLQQDLDDSNASIHITRRRIVEMQAANQKKQQKALVEQVAEEDNALFSIFVDTAAGAGGADDDATSEKSSTSRSSNSSKRKKSRRDRKTQAHSASSLHSPGSASDLSSSSDLMDCSSSSEDSVDSNGAACSPTRIKAYVGESNDIPAVIRDVSGHRYHLSSKCLGKGAFGEVFLAMDGHGTLLATKIFRLAAAAGNAAQWAAAGGNEAAVEAAAGEDASESMTPEERRKFIADQKINANARATAYTLMNEVEVLAQLRHPNIASYVSCAVVGKEGQYFAMMMEYLSAGSLRSMMDDEHFGGLLPASSFPQKQIAGVTPPPAAQPTPAPILSMAETLDGGSDSDDDDYKPRAPVAPVPVGPRKHRGAGVGGHRVLPRPAVLSYIKDVLKGIAFLHEQQYVHCDVKPENVLLTAEGTCKLADFGTAKLMDDYDITGVSDEPQVDGGILGGESSTTHTAPTIGPRVVTASGGGGAGRVGRVWGGGGAHPSQEEAAKEKGIDAFASTSSARPRTFSDVNPFQHSSTSSQLNIVSSNPTPSVGEIIPSATVGAYTLEEEEERQRVLGAMVRGTPRYMAPEAVLGTFTKAADMFSFGILIVELVTGEHPWSHILGSDTTFMMRLARDETMQPKVYRHLFYTPRQRRKLKSSSLANVPSSISTPKEDGSSDPLPWDVGVERCNKFDISCSDSLGDDDAMEDDDEFFFGLMNNADSDGEDEDDGAPNGMNRSPQDPDNWIESSVTEHHVSGGLTREAIRRRSLLGSASNVVAGGKRHSISRKTNSKHLQVNSIDATASASRLREIERERRRKERRKQRRRLGQRYIDDHIGKVLFHVVRRCLRRNPESRPSVHQILEWLGAE